jgi:protein gp37
MVKKATPEKKVSPLQKTKIEWTDYTWNPVSGCLHPCRNTYCYNTQKKTAPLLRFGAKYLDPSGKIVYQKNWQSRETGENHLARAGEVYPYGYDPTFYPHRLQQPLITRTPGKVFVVDVGDLFGKWVPVKWIEDVLGIVNECPWHTFQFLTKNPKRCLEFEFPGNAWVGTTVNSDKDAARANIIKKVKAPVRFLSVEPLLGAVTFNLKGIQWVILGAQTGPTPLIPQRKWIDDIIIQTTQLNIPLFMKGNIRSYSPTFMQQFP